MDDNDMWMVEENVVVEGNEHNSADGFFVAFGWIASNKGVLEIYKVLKCILETGINFNLKFYSSMKIEFFKNLNELLH